MSCKSVCSIKYAQLTRMKPLAAFIDVHYLGFYSIINNRGEADTRPLISLRCAAHPRWRLRPRCAENISPASNTCPSPRKVMLPGREAKIVFPFLCRGL